jgi:hypothetical protein
VQIEFLHPIQDQQICTMLCPRKMSRGRGCFGNKHVALDRLRSVAIAISAEHSTGATSRTIILISNVRVEKRHFLSGAFE